MVTRLEYIAGSLSTLKPWLTDGISRRQWERRRLKITGVANAPAKGDLTDDVGSPVGNAPRDAVGSANDIRTMPAHKTSQWADEDLLMRRIHAYWDEHSMTRSDPQALAKAIHAIILPERFKHMDSRALGKVYRRARKRLPVRYDQWAGLIEKWDKSYDRRKVRDLVDRLVGAVGDRHGFLDQLFDHLQQQICDHLPKRVRRLEYECERLKQNKYYLPQLRRLKPDAIKEQVHAALVDGPKTKKELARMFGKPYGAISSVGRRLRNEGRIMSIWQEGQFMWALASTAPPFIPARDAIEAVLKNGPMTVGELARNIGKHPSTVKSALKRHLLPNGTVIRTKFNAYALAGTAPPYVSGPTRLLRRWKKVQCLFRHWQERSITHHRRSPSFLNLCLRKVQSFASNAAFTGYVAAGRSTLLHATQSCRLWSNNR